MNKSQNIYDNQTFFDNYKQLRDRDDNYNDLLEQPAMTDLLPDLTGKAVLDLGCGYGYNCKDFIKRGASKVVGIDLSEKMLDIARSEADSPNIEYRCMDMTEISKLDERFDLVYSSLAFHYIEDFELLISEIFGLLNGGGWLQYSQEHPIITATIDGKGHFNRDENGNRISYTFSNYNEPGKREIFWIVDGVVKYHRTIGEIITTIAKSGFVVDTVCEPTPKAWAIEKLPAIIKEFIKPNFLLIKAQRG